MSTIAAPDEHFLTQLASTTPLPAGGAALGYAAAMAAALVTMTAQITQIKANRSAYLPDEEAASSAQLAQVIRTRLLDLIQADCSAYEQYLSARRQVASQPQAWADAQLAIIEIPMQIAELSAQTGFMAMRIVANGYAQVAADALAAAYLAYAALSGSLLNARTNLLQSQTLDSAPQAFAKITSLEKEARKLLQQIQRTAALRIGLPGS